MILKTKRNSHGDSLPSLTNFGMVINNLSLNIGNTQIWSQSEGSIEAIAFAFSKKARLALQQAWITSRQAEAERTLD